MPAPDMFAWVSFARANCAPVERRPAQVAIGQVRIVEQRARKIGVAQIGADELGVAQIRFRQRTTLQVRIAQIDAGQNHAFLADDIGGPPPQPRLRRFLQEIETGEIRFEVLVVPMLVPAQHAVVEQPFVLLRRAKLALRHVRVHGLPAIARRRSVGCVIRRGLCARRPTEKNTAPIHDRRSLARSQSQRLGRRRELRCGQRRDLVRVDHRLIGDLEPRQRRLHVARFLGDQRQSAPRHKPTRHAATGCRHLRLRRHLRRVDPGQGTLRAIPSRCRPSTARNLRALSPPPRRAACRRPQQRFRAPVPKPSGRQPFVAIAMRSMNASADRFACSAASVPCAASSPDVNPAPSVAKKRRCSYKRIARHFGRCSARVRQQAPAQRRRMHVRRSSPASRASLPRPQTAAREPRVAHQHDRRTRPLHRTASRQNGVGHQRQQRQPNQARRNHDHRFGHNASICTSPTPQSS